MRARSAAGGATLVVLLVVLLVAGRSGPAAIGTFRGSLLGPGFQRGFNVTAYTALGFSGSTAASSLTALARTGTDHAALVPTWYQPTVTSDDVAPQPGKTVSDASLLEGARLVRERGMQVVLKPHVDVRDGSFRGDIRPADPAAWFASYTRMIVHYAALAQRTGAALLVVGDELTGVQGERAPWARLIAAVRRVYQGKLTYAANWDPGYRAVPFWSLLDYVGIDAYQPLTTGTTTPAVDALVGAWRPVVAGFRAAAAATGRPVLVTELGYPARRDSTSAPAREDTTARLDDGAQARAYEAAYRALRDLPFVAGLYWWDWAADARGNEPDGGAGGYRPAGKPAEHVVRDFSR